MLRTVSTNTALERLTERQLCMGMRFFCQWVFWDELLNELT